MAKEPIGADDPNVVIPPAVRAAAERANAHFKKKEAAPPQQAAPPATPQAEPAPAPTPQATPAPAPAPEPATAQVAPPTEPAAPPPPPPEPPKERNWENAYKAMKGRYERAETEKREIRARMAELESTVVQLQQQLTTPSKKPGAAPLVTPKDVEEYGEDLVDFVGRRARAEVDPVLQSLQSTVQDLKKKVDGTTQTVVMTARERMYATLDERCPQWRVLNNDDNFLDWLDLPDRFSGVIRQQLLNAAVEQLDTPRVLEFFQGFLREAALAPAATPQTTELTPPLVPQSQKVALESFAAPGRARTAAAPAPVTEKPVITPQQIRAFYDQVRRGRYRGREAEQREIEQMISDASREGRIVNQGLPTG